MSKVITPRASLVLLAVLCFALASCDEAKDAATVAGLTDRVGQYEHTFVTPTRLARKLSYGYRVEGTRDIVNAKTKDKGVEVTIDFPGGKTGNFKVYKLASDSNLRKIAGTYKRIERTFTAHDKKVYVWDFVSRKDMLLDTKMIPHDEREALEKRFKRMMSRAKSAP